MAFDALANFASSTVLTPPTPPDSGTTLVLAAGTGGRFPAAVSGDVTTHFNVVISPVNAQPLSTNSEIARCTNRSGDTLTLTRTQEGTAARTILVGDTVSAAVTAKRFTDLESQITAIVPPVIGSGALGTEPAPAVAGYLFFPTDAPFVERYNGTIWSPFGPIYPLTRPVNGDFAWVNQGGASISAANGSLYLLGPAGAGVNWRLRTKAAPATPYVITAAFLLDGLSVDFHQVGLVWRASGSGALVVFSLQTNPAADLPQLGTIKYTNPTTFSAIYTQARYMPRSPIWLRIADDGVNRIASFSPDGFNWQVLHTIGRTDFLTANEIGFGVDCENATFPVGLTLLSWKET